MRILVLTQKVDINDSLLGFFHDWLLEFSKKCGKIIVVCLYEGKHNLPPNVEILSLGKEFGVSRLKYLARFFRYIFTEKNSYDAVFVHMNQTYVILGGIFWRVWGKKIGLFYTHRQKSFSLWLAEKLTNVVFTAAKESFTLKSRKVKIVGHGIETGRFSCPDRPDVLPPKIHLLSVGRITKIKNLETFIESVGRLVKQGADVEAKIVGVPIYETDFEYKKDLEKLIKNSNLTDKVSFVGAVSNLDLPKYYCEADISVNLTPTGGIDKVVLESMAAGTIPLVSNEAFKSIFGPFAKELVFSFGNAKDLSDKLIFIKQNSQLAEMRQYLKEEVRKNWSVENVVGKITKELA